MRGFSGKSSRWSSGLTAPAEHRSGPDPINPLRIERLRQRGLTYHAIGVVIAKEDGRRMRYTAQGVKRAHWEWQKGIRDDEGDKPFRPATNKRQTKISLGAGIGAILFRT